MSDLTKINIDDEYLIRDKSTSDGSQIKYYKDNRWYKLDYHGGEAEAESLASLLLFCTNLDRDKYVKYDKININDMAGCVSDDFRQSDEEEFITLYRLYKNIYGRDLAAVTSKMDYDDAIMYVIEFVKETIGIDITTYLANTFWLDSIILNTDRHFNNYGIIMSGEKYREAPIFDNGKSLLTGSKADISRMSISEAVNSSYSKSFSPNFQLNYNYLKKYCTITLDKEKITSLLRNYEETTQKKVLEYQLAML